MPASVLKARILGGTGEKTHGACREQFQGRGYGVGTIGAGPGTQRRRRAIEGVRGIAEEVDEDEERGE